MAWGASNGTGISSPDWLCLHRLPLCLVRGSGSRRFRRLLASKPEIAPSGNGCRSPERCTHHDVRCTAECCFSNWRGDRLAWIPCACIGGAPQLYSSCFGQRSDLGTLALPSDTVRHLQQPSSKVGSPSLLHGHDHRYRSASGVATVENRIGLACRDASCLS